MTPQEKALALTSQEKDAELVRLWKLEESLKPRPIETAPKDEKFLGCNLGLLGQPYVDIFYWSDGWKDINGKMHEVGYRTHSAPPRPHNFKAWLPYPKFNLEEK